MSMISYLQYILDPIRTLSEKERGRMLKSTINLVFWTRKDKLTQIILSCNNFESIG